MTDSIMNGRNIPEPMDDNGSGTHTSERLLP